MNSSKGYKQIEKFRIGLQNCLINCIQDSYSLTKENR